MTCRPEDHDWQLAGVTTATDGYRCSKCGKAIEVEADGDPYTAPWNPRRLADGEQPPEPGDSVHG